MKKVIIQRLHAENFKVFKNYDAEFGRVTRISGMNGAGKSSLASAIMWVLFGVDYDLTNNPKVRREVNGEPVNDVPVSVEIVIDVDGKEITARKTQKRSIAKDGSYADTNSYSINGVSKTLRDFNAYFDFSFDDLLMCMNPAAFLSQKPKEMREFLFKLPKDISDRDIVARFPELSGLAELIGEYTVEEISMMNKATITRLSKEIAGYPGRIDEVNRQIVEDEDAAELELQANALKEQIAEIERQEEDTLAQSGEMDAMKRNLLELKDQKSEIEEKAADDLRAQRKDIQEQLDGYNASLRHCRNQRSFLELDIQRIEGSITRKKSEKDGLLSEYEKEAAESFPEYEPLPELSDDALVCPTCGQEFPKERIEQILAEQEERRKQHFEKYQKDRADFEQAKADKLTAITERGRNLKNEIEELETVKLPEKKETLANVDGSIEAEIGNIKRVQAMLDAMPLQPDLSGNQEYEALCLEICAKEEAIRSMSAGDDSKKELRNRKAEVQAELDSVKARLARVNNNAALEDRLEELREEQMQKEQAKADSEKTLDLLNELDKRKNELLVADINSHFGGRVTWDLFSYAKNGSYKADFCVPRIDGYTLNDNTANHGRELEAMVIIAESVQKIVGINAPVLLDNSEVLDSGNLKRILDGADCQMIVFAVSDEKELKIATQG